MVIALSQVLVGAVTAVVVGVLAGPGWPHLLMGALLALALWVMLLAGRDAGDRGRRVDPVVYAGAAVLGVLFGLLATWLGDGAGWWPVGFILAGAIAPSVGQRGRVEAGGRDR